MAHQHDVRIPPRRLRLLGILLAYAAFALLGSGATAGMLSALLHGQSLLLAPLFLVFALGTGTGAAVAVWALVYLALNLPAVHLTPTALINHSVVWHVALPWQEVEEFAYSVSSGNRRTDVYSIVVFVKDKRRLYAHQWLLTTVLLRLFGYLHPLNINTAMTAEAPEVIGAQLERYVREVVGNTHIRFTAI